MADWHATTWHYILQELRKLERQYPDAKSYTVKHTSGYVHLTIDGDDRPYLFDMGGYAGETSAEIAHNLAKDIVENYLM